MNVTSDPETGGRVQARPVFALHRHDRLAVAVADHELEHARYTDEHKQVVDHGWWALVDRTERRTVLDLHGRAGSDAMP